MNSEIIVINTRSKKVFCEYYSNHVPARHDLIMIDAKLFLVQQRQFSPSTNVVRLYVTRHKDEH